MLRNLINLATCYSELRYNYNKTFININLYTHIYVGIFIKRERVVEIKIKIERMKNQYFLFITTFISIIYFN